MNVFLVFIFSLFWLNAWAVSYGGLPDEGGAVHTEDTISRAVHRRILADQERLHRLRTLYAETQRVQAAYRGAVRMASAALKEMSAELAQLHQKTQRVLRKSQEQQEVTEHEEI